jgi:organic radical activating enzyme
VITGGEPLLQENDFLEMITHIRAHQSDCVFEVETNGTRTPSPAFAEAVDQFNVSPKLSNSGVKTSLRLVPDTLRFFASSPKSWFKFVIACMADLDEVLALQNEFSIPASRILLMPEGRTAAELDTTAADIAELCRTHGFRFCDRLHIRLWGDKRGV